MQNVMPTLGGQYPDIFTIADENQPYYSHLAINTIAGYPPASDGKYDIIIRESSGQTDTVGGALIEQAT